MSTGAIVRGVSWVGFGHLVSQACWFGSLVILAAHVAPATFGAVALVMVGLQIAWLVIGAGTRGAFIVAPVLGRRDVLRAFARNVGVASLVASAAIAIPDSALHLLLPGSDPAVFRVLFASVALYAAAIVPLALLQKELRFKEHALAQAVAAVSASAGSVVAVLLGAGVWALVGRQVAYQALLALLAWSFARRLLPSPGAEGVPLRPAVAHGFLGLALISFIALNMDNIVIAHVADVGGLGLYALAFTIAFAPMTQVAWQVGKVLFPAAARLEPDEVAARAAKALRLTGLLICPVLPVAALAAPAAVPAVLGEEWLPMIGPLQILLVAGTAHALLAILREFLLGRGCVGLCLRIEGSWLAATLLALVPAVAWAGIVGAAGVHLVSVLPLGAAYARWGLPRLGLRPRELWRALAPIGLVVAGEALCGTAVVLAATAAGLAASTSWALAALGAAVAGAGILAAGARPVLREGRAAVRSARVVEGVM